MQPDSDFAQVNGTRLYYEEAGAGDPVVLIHGFTLDTRMWDDQFAPLARRFRAIRYDMRGFGRSAVPGADSYTHHDDLCALLDHLGVEQAHLVGLSKGGAVALDLALANPQRVRSLALIDTVIGGFPWSPETTARDGLVWQRAHAGGISAAKESWRAHPLFAPAFRRPEVAARLGQIIDEYSGWHFVNASHEHGLEPPAAQRLKELTVPVLAIVGEHDTPDFRAVTELICRELPQARRLVVPGAGHMANMEAPAQVTEALLTFLTSL